MSSISFILDYEMQPSATSRFEIESCRNNKNKESNIDMLLPDQSFQLYERSLNKLHASTSRHICESKRNK